MFEELTRRELEVLQHLARGRIASRLFQSLVLTVAIRPVANQGKAEKLEMHPDLVCSARVQDCLGQRCPAQSLEDLVTGSRLAAKFIIDRHAFSM